MEKQTILEQLRQLLKKHNNADSYNLGLVLSGGAARGYAHLGVLKALEENELKPDIISGVSAGAIAAAFYAKGFSPEETVELFQSINLKDILNIRPSKKGLLKTDGLKKLLQNHLGKTKIEDLELPVVIAATNLNEGKTHYFKHGNLVDAVLASCSIPVVFNAVKMESNLFIDGGVTNNFPLEPLEGKCKKIIGVHVNPTGKFNMNKGMLHLAVYAFHLSIASGIEEKKKQLEYFIEPHKLKDFSYMDIDKGQEMFDIGYKEAIQLLSVKE
jgi:NTE family protein